MREWARPVPLGRALQRRWLGRTVHGVVSGGEGDNGADKNLLGQGIHRTPRRIIMQPRPSLTATHNSVRSHSPKQRTVCGALSNAGAAMASSITDNAKYLADQIEIQRKYRDYEPDHNALLEAAVR